MPDADVQVARTCDPLSVAIPLPYGETVYPYGFAVRVVSNSRLITEMAVDNWRQWSHRFNNRPLEIRCVIQTNGVSERPLSEPVYRAQRNLFTITVDADNMATCDLATGFGFGWFCENVVTERERFRYLFLEGMVYSMLESLHTLSVHAACVSLNSRGVLLAGESGAGKSTLAYACALRGWTYISDDASVVIRDSQDNTVFGECRRFRFRDTAGGIFPELRGLSNSSNRPMGGKPTLEVATDTLRGIRTAQEANVCSVVFLKRHHDVLRRPELVRFSDRKEASKRLFTHVWPDELPNHQERLHALQNLLNTDMFELHYCDLDLAVTALKQLCSQDRS